MVKEVVQRSSSFAAVMKASPASAADFTFTQGNYDSGGVLSGTFSGTPDSNGWITNPTAFSATYTSTDPSLNDLSFDINSLNYEDGYFSYNPSASPVLSFSAYNGRDFVDVPCFSFNGNYFGGSLTNYAARHTGSTNSNALVTAASVPEPTNVMRVT